MTDPVSVRNHDDPDNQGYPRVVVRQIAGCYQDRGLPEHVGGHEAVVTHALEYSSRLERSTCPLFGPKEAWHREPDGSRRLSDQLPSGGVLIEQRANYVSVSFGGTTEIGRGFITDSDATSDEGR